MYVPIVAMWSIKGLVNAWALSHPAYRRSDLDMSTGSGNPTVEDHFFGWQEVNDANGISCAKRGDDGMG